MGTHPIFESDFDCLTEMEIISYSKIVNELKQACTLEPDCAAVVFDSSTGELVAWSGHKSNQEAVSTAAALFGLWNSQSETAGQHDDTLAIQGSNDIQLGALKRLCQQSASNFKSVIYEPS